MEETKPDYKGSGVKLHRPDGTEIYVNPRAIAYVREPLEGELGNATITFSSGAKQTTLESVSEIIDALAKDKPEINIPNDLDEEP
jgi:uncharacterized protein YlzI (FlbEa/FlbD family)